MSRLTLIAVSVERRGDYDLLFPKKRVAQL